MGVKTTNPLADLHVAGTARIDGGLTVPATVRYRSYGAFAFIPVRPETSITFFGSNAVILDQTSILAILVRATTAVHLPDGAVITQLQGTFIDTASSENATLTLLRQNLTAGSFTELGVATTSGSGGLQTRTDSVIASSTVDNANYAYWLAFEWKPPGSDTGTIHALTARLTYEVTNLLP